MVVLHRFDRIRIAKAITKRIVSGYAGQIQLVALCGSVARLEDKEFSDVDLVIVAKREIPSRLYVRNGVVVECIFATKKHLLETLSNPSAEWWFGWAGLFASPRFLYGDRTILEEFEDSLRAMPYSRYKKAAKDKLLWMLEEVNHIRNAHSSRDLAAAMGYANYYRNTVGEFIGLINGRHYSSHVFRTLEEAKDFQEIPERYFDQMVELGTSNNLERINQVALQLFEACSAIARERGISWKTERLAGGKERKPSKL